MKNIDIIKGVKRKKTITKEKNKEKHKITTIRFLDDPFKHDEKDFLGINSFMKHEKQLEQEKK